MGGIAMDMKAEDQAGAAVEDGAGITHAPVLAAGYFSSVTEAFGFAGWFDGLTMRKEKCASS
jgi:hypothetical protein